MTFFIVLISSFFITVQSLDLETLRMAYKDAAQDKTKVEAFYNSLENVTKSDKIELVGYKAAAMALKAKYAKAIKDKKEGFIEGITLLEYAIKKDQNNIELRFIRLSIQENTPKLLKYKDEIETDKNFILKQFNTIKSSSLKNTITDYISQSKAFTDEEKSVILE